MFAVCSALAIAAELSLSAFSATAALTGAATFALMSDIAARSGSSSPSVRLSSSSLSSSGFFSAWPFVTWCLLFPRVRRNRAATRHVRVGGFFAHVGRDRRIDVSNQVNAPARSSDTALDDLANLHFIVLAQYRPEQTRLRGP